MRNLMPKYKLQPTKHCPQFGRTVIFSTLSLYQSLVIGLTDYKSLAHFGYAFCAQAYFGSHKNNSFL